MGCCFVDNEAAKLESKMNVTLQQGRPAAQLEQRAGRCGNRNVQYSQQHNKSVFIRSSAGTSSCLWAGRAWVDLNRFIQNWQAGNLSAILSWGMSVFLQLNMAACCTFSSNWNMKDSLSDHGPSLETLWWRSQALRGIQNNGWLSHLLIYLRNWSAWYILFQFALLDDMNSPTLIWGLSGDNSCADRHANIASWLRENHRLWCIWGNIHCLLPGNPHRLNKTLLRWFKHPRGRTHGDMKKVHPRALWAGDRLHQQFVNELKYYLVWLQQWSVLKNKTKSQLLGKRSQSMFVHPEFCFSISL